MSHSVGKKKSLRKSSTHGACDPLLGDSLEPLGWQLQVLVLVCLLGHKRLDLAEVSTPKGTILEHLRRAQIGPEVGIISKLREYDTSGCDSKEALH